MPANHAGWRWSVTSISVAGSSPSSRLGWGDGQRIPQFARADVSAIRRLLASTALTFAGACATGSGTVAGSGTGNAISAGTTRDAPPGFSAITEADLRRDIFVLAGDAMRGREAGTLDELRATEWLVDRAREAGLEPAGDDGTFLQFWPMRRTRVSETSAIEIGGRPLALWRDVVVTSRVASSVDAPLLWLDRSADAQANLAG